ncbi:MAG: peptidylprolyl isomerase [Planctomycetota bacterium]|nr:peptidylprolyl isomerase [Planctomycetota bacterium]
MDSKTQPTRGQSASDPAGGMDPALIRKIVIGTVVALALGFAFMLWRAWQDEGRLDRWDTLEAIRVRHEPAQDPIWENPYGVYNEEREKYIGALEQFLTEQAATTDDALAPHTRFMIAKTIADHILANPGMLDQSARGEWYTKAVKHLEAIRDQHPDFPLNWTMLNQDGLASLTRQFIKWLEANRAWEQEHMLSATAPDAGTRVLVRTTRGDMLLGLYGEFAPAWTKAFVERAASGAYDGRFFVEKRDIGDAAEPGEHGFRSGGAASRGLEAYDVKGVRAASEVKSRAGVLPEEARNRIPLDRGIVAVWHDGGDEYDTDDLLLVVTSRSPYLDYKYTPIGRLVDESGITSLLTADRIFGGDVWRAEDSVRDDSESRGVLDWFQVPVQIVKVLVYRDGALVEPSGAAAESRVAPEDSERKLSSVKADRFKQETPTRPVAPKKSTEDADKAPDAGKDDAGKDDDDAK